MQVHGETNLDRKLYHSLARVNEARSDQSLGRLEIWGRETG